MNYVRFLLLWSRMSWHLRKSAFNIEFERKEQQSIQNIAALIDKCLCRLFWSAKESQQSQDVLNRTSGDRDGEKNFSIEMMPYVRAVSRGQIIAISARSLRSTVTSGELMTSSLSRKNNQRGSLNNHKRSLRFPLISIFSVLFRAKKKLFRTKPHIQSFRNCWEARNRKETRESTASWF